MSYYAAAKVFGFRARLTAFKSARNIVRIRTKWPGCEEAAPVGAFSTAGLFMTDATVAGGDKIRCDACPVMCYIKPGAAGACDRYANHNGELVRVDPHIVLERTVSHGGRLVPFQAGGDRLGLRSEIEYSLAPNQVDLVDWPRLSA